MTKTTETQRQLNYCYPTSRWLMIEINALDLWNLPTRGSDGLQTRGTHPLSLTNQTTPQTPHLSTENTTSFALHRPRDQISMNPTEDQTKTKGAMLFNMGNIQSNARTIQWIRSFMSLTGGTMMGILGFTGLQGFIGFLILHVVVSTAIVAKASFSLTDYVPGSKLPNFLIEGLTGELMSFLLFWTMFYGLVHVY